MHGTTSYISKAKGEQTGQAKDRVEDQDLDDEDGGLQVVLHVQEFKNSRRKRTSSKKSTGFLFLFLSTLSSSCRHQRRRYGGLIDDQTSKGEIFPMFPCCLYCMYCSMTGTSPRCRHSLWGITLLYAYRVKDSSYVHCKSSTGFFLDPQRELSAR